MAKKPILKKRTKLKKKVPIVRLFLNAEFNNSIVTMTDLEGKVIAWASAGKVGFKGSKKSTPFAAQRVTEDVLEVYKIVEANSAHVIIKGAGPGRDSFLRALQSANVEIDSIKDATTFPHGGVTKRKRRRV
jgi:small subunit ribosomal protein S11